MKKILFAVDKNSFNNPDHAGVNKKVHSQIKQMEKGGNEVALLQYEWVNGNLLFDIKEDTDVLYFRRIESSLKLIGALKRCKEINPKIKIMMELPTFPFEGEQKKRNIKTKINNFVGDLLLKRFIDRIIICGIELPLKKFKGIPVMYFSNGIDGDSIALNAYTGEKDEIHMICVSGCMLSHGYDRMIKGMKDYYDNNPERKVFFHIVGTGDYYAEYEKLAKQFELYDKYVMFYGRKTGDELEKIYSKCNLAVAHLAAHRVGLTVMSSLKSREYAIKGMPFVSCTKFDFSNENTDKYICYVDSNEENIDIEKVVGFFDRVYEEQDVNRKMRETFEPLCAWENTFANVISYINE